MKSCPTKSCAVSFGPHNISIISVMYLDLFQVFTAGDSINEKSDPSPVKYAAVVSSLDYPNENTNRLVVYLSQMPLDSYITYTIINPAIYNFEGEQAVKVLNSDSETSFFNATLSEPFSYHHTKEGEITFLVNREAERSPVFLIKFAGMSKFFILIYSIEMCGNW